MSTYNLTSSASSSSTSIIWGGQNLIGGAYGGISSGTYTTNNTYPARVVPNLKRCRSCSHAHLAEQSGCIDQEGWNTIFVSCTCKEYVPSDNLEYLEYLYKKKENK